MADSKFLKWQDKDGDGLSDVCNDIIDVPAAHNCPPCVPNPYALAPDWRTFSSTSAYFNEKTCQYEVVVATTHNSLLDSVILDIYDEYKTAAVEEILIEFNKAETDENKIALSNTTGAQSHYLDVPTGSRVLLLYSTTYESLADLADAEPDDDNDEDEDEDEDSNAIVHTSTYTAETLNTEAIKVRRGLWLYSKYLNVYRAVDGGNLFFEESRLLFNLEQYGDSGILNGSVIATALTDLDEWLNGKGYNMVGIGRGSLFKDKVTNIEFNFNDSYKLKRLRIWTSGCGDVAIVFGVKKLKSLNKKDPFKDPTAMAYLSQLSEMTNDLSAREPGPWIDFLTQYTYPKIFETFDFPVNRDDAEETVESCVGDALQSELKQLGQDILDPAFSLGDAIAYAFRKETCKKDVGDVQKEDIRLALRYAPNVDPSLNKNIFVMAREQAFMELQQQDQTFKSVCASLLGGDTSPKGFSKAMSSDLLQGLWEDGFSKLKICGFEGILMEVVGCLAGALSLDEALGKIISSALRALSLENFGDLFAAIPLEKQQEIEDQVRVMLATGEVFGKSTTVQKLSTAADNASNRHYRPFETPELLAQEKADSKPVSTERTLAKSYDKATDNNYDNAPTIMGMYVEAIVETYTAGDNDLGLLSLVDLLNKYPGAQLIANIIAALECPGPPKINPTVPEWFKDFSLPTCRNGWKLGAPKLENPFAWIPDIKDFTKILFQLLKQAILQAIGLALVKLLSKICNLLGNAMCKALETVGSLAASLPDVATGQTTFKDIVVDAICGDNATTEQTDKAIEELFESLGIGAQALSDKEAVQQFVSEISSAVTRSELSDAFLGNASAQTLTIIDNIAEQGYPQFRPGFPNRDSIGNFFKNVGNLFPADFKDQLKNLPEDPPGQAGEPANPLLCSTPEDLENFCNTRAALLEGRVSEKGASGMCRAMRDKLADDLEDIGDILQGGIPKYIERNIPPIVSDPGCDNGMIPFESEEALASSGEITKGIFKQLKNAFSKDMLNNGPGMANWGMMNMIMSDTMGNPLTAHHRKTTWSKRNVNFYSDAEEDATRQAPTVLQEGAYPVKIAEWLQFQYQGSAEDDGYAETATSLSASLNFVSNNDYRSPRKTYQSFSKLGIKEGWGGVYNVNAMSFPDQGYNVVSSIDLDRLSVSFLELGRKATPDMTLQFKDNAKGLRSGPGETRGGSEYSYGFDIEMYTSDLVSQQAMLTGSTTGFTNRFDDNMRIKIMELQNFSSKYIDPKAADVEEEMSAASTTEREGSVLSVLKYEFLSFDNTLDPFKTILDRFPAFANCFIMEQEYMPQVVLLTEMASQYAIGAPELSNDDTKAFYDAFATHISQTFRADIGNNTPAFDYGAKYDDLSRADTEYVLSSGYRDSGINYAEAEIEDPETGEYRPITSNDMILGVSRMQYEIEAGTYTGVDSENRIFYLDPTQFGGTYMNPSIYIKPQKTEGWMSIIDVMFPQLGPCKPQRTDLIDFQEIQDMVDEIYTTLAPDPRMKIEDTECLVQKPYNRLLERRSAATIEGLIIAACRIFASTHFLKTLATFTTFKPDFKNVYSSVYAQYIVENMEAAFKDAAPDRFEQFSAFKDEEFWYAFLEQSVQMYARKCDTGEIDPPTSAQRALSYLNDMQEIYLYPSKQDLLNDKEANRVRLVKTLKNYRADKNLEAVYATEEQAKLILKEIVSKEIEVMAEKFLINLKTAGIEPTVSDIDYYTMRYFTQGSTLDLDKEIVEETEEMPTEPAPEGEAYYTVGSEFSVFLKLGEHELYEEGDVYTGYYHVHENDDGSIAYMSGPTHTGVPHDLLKPMANKVIVPIGDVADYGFEPIVATEVGAVARAAIDAAQIIIDLAQEAVDASPLDDTLQLALDAAISAYETVLGTFGLDSETVAASGQPFLIEKYISINGEKYSPSEAQNIILANNPGLNLSEVYPGNMEQVIATSGQITGVIGDLGVMYGLQLSIIINGEKYQLTQVEMSALDLPIAQFPPLDKNTKLLYCLVKMLKASKGFQLITKYIFPMKNILSVLAIYNDMAFLPSIGEWTVKFGDTYSKTLSEKPGISVVATEGDEEGEYDIELEEKVGWSAIGERTTGWTPFVTTWDEWDQDLLNKSRWRLKRLFRSQYNSRDFKPGQFPDLGINGPGQIFMRKMRAKMIPDPGGQLLPWWKKRKLKSNPFNSDGHLCEKDDD